MKKLPILFLILTFIGCTKQSNQSSEDLESINQLKGGMDSEDFLDYSQFWGDSTIIIISSNRPNDYMFKIFQSQGLSLLNLSRGDSINVYIPISNIPLTQIQDFKEEGPGTYIRDFDVPVASKLGRGWFFMDGDFDGNEEFVIEYPGYNRRYFAFFDLENGDSRTMPGFLMANNHPPFNNIVEGENSYTIFDPKQKTIYIDEYSGNGYYHVWAEMTTDNDFEDPHLEVVRKEHTEFINNVQITTYYERIDKELKETEQLKVNLDN